MRTLAIVLLLAAVAPPGRALACSCKQGIPNCMICCPADFAKAMASDPASAEQSLRQLDDAPAEVKARVRPMLAAAERMKVLAGDTLFGGKQQEDSLARQVRTEIPVSSALDELETKAYLEQAALHQNDAGGTRALGDAAWNDLVGSGLTTPSVRVRGYDLNR